MMLLWASEIVEDEVARPEQRADGRDVGGMAADEGQRKRPVHSARGERLSSAWMDRALARDDAARRGRRAVTVDGGMRGGSHRFALVEAEIVVGGKIGEPPTGDDRRRAAFRLVFEKVGIAQSNRGGGCAQEPLLRVARQRFEIQMPRDVRADRRAFGGSGGRSRLAPSADGAREQFPVGLCQTSHGCASFAFGPKPSGRALAEMDVIAHLLQLWHINEEEDEPDRQRVRWRIVRLDSTRRRSLPGSSRSSEPSASTRRVSGLNPAANRP